MISYRYCLFNPSVSCLHYDVFLLLYTFSFTFLHCFQLRLVPLIPRHNKNVSTYWVIKEWIYALIKSLVHKIKFYKDLLFRRYKGQFILMWTFFHSCFRLLFRLLGHYYMVSTIRDRNLLLGSIYVHSVNRHSYENHSYDPNKSKVLCYFIVKRISWYIAHKRNFTFIWITIFYFLLIMALNIHTVNVYNTIKYHSK